MSSGTTQRVGDDAIARMLEHWPHDTVLVNGPDAATYLHSQLSQDLRDLAVGAQAWSLVLQPNGRVDALVLVRRTSDEAFELQVDLGFGEALIARLNRFRIRVKAEVSLAGSHSGNPESFLAARVAAGWPAMGAEITDASIPAEFPEVVARSVSFSKGCYPGQELVERMDSRSAEAPRHLERFEVGADAVVGDPIVREGNEVGVITSVAVVDGATIALALVRRGA